MLNVKYSRIFCDIIHLFTLVFIREVSMKKIMKDLSVAVYEI